MKPVLAFSILFALGLSAALADGEGTPVDWRHGGQEVIMRSSMKTIHLVDGDNVLGKPVVFTCRSAAGCMLVIEASVEKDNDPGNGITCAYVDDIPPAPGCGNDPAFYELQTSRIIHQQAKVGLGDHTAKLVASNGAGADVTGWAVRYTIYERKVRGVD